MLDDKIILGWNALMNTACSKAFMATGNERYKQLAISNMQFLLEKFSERNSNGFFHTWKNETAKYPAFLDDYAFLVQALIHLQEISSDTKWLTRAKDIAEFVIDNFSEEETGFFYFTKASQQDVIIRKKEVYDGAVPSGNSIMACNLYQLSILFDQAAWKDKVLNMTGSLVRAISQYPTSFGIWACLFQEILYDTLEIAIVGNDHESLKTELFEHYLPHRVLMTTDIEGQSFALLAGKAVKEKSQVYLCKGHSCQQPVDSIERFMSLIDSSEKVN